MQCSNGRAGMGMQIAGSSSPTSDLLPLCRTGDREDLFLLEKELKSQWSKPMSDSWMCIVTADIKWTVVAVFGGLLHLNFPNWTRKCYHPLVTHKETEVCDVKGACPWPHRWEGCDLNSLAPGSASPERCNKMAFVQSAVIDELLNRVCTKQNFIRETFMPSYFRAAKSLWFDTDCLHFYGVGIKPTVERTGFSPRSSWSVWPGIFLGLNH